MADGVVDAGTASPMTKSQYETLGIEALLTGVLPQAREAYVEALAIAISHNAPESPNSAGMRLLADAMRAAGSDRWLNGRPVKRESSFSDDDLALLATWLSETRLPDLAASIGEVLWEKTKDRSAADQAVTSLLQVIQVLANSEGAGHLVKRRLEACIRLSRPVQRVAEVLETGRAVLLRRDKNMEGRDVEVTKLLVTTDRNNVAKYRSDAERLASQLESIAATAGFGDLLLHQARRAWDLALECEKRSENRATETQRIKLRAARTYVLEADRAKAAKEPFVEAGFLDRAVDRYQRAHADKELIDSLLARSVTARRNTELAEVSVSVPAANLRREGAKAVEGMQLRDALTRLAALVALRPLDELRTDVMTSFERNPIRRLLPKTVLKGRGLVAKHLSPEDEGETSKINEDFLKNSMWEELDYERLMACCYIEGALGQIALEHAVSVGDVSDLLEGSWLIPPGHEFVFARGILAGILSDFTAACYILIPQLENGLRAFVEDGLGKNLVQQEADGSQMAGLMARILGTRELQEVLGDTVIFDLKGLLIAQESINLRNRLMHGLLGDEGLGYHGIYAWWIVFSLSMRLRPMRLPDASPTTEDADRNADEDGIPAPHGEGISNTAGDGAS